MAVKTTNATREYIEAAPLPAHGQTYTVISHKFVIDETLAALAANGFEIDKELYRCNQNADIAQGVYHLKYDGDPEMGMMFTWANSYDKSMRFRCAAGSFVYVSENRLISGRSKDSWSRKHTGTADQQAREMIERYINNAGAYYKELVDTKAQMKLVTVPLQTRAELLGRLFFEKNLLSAEQMLIIKEQFRSKKFDYNTPEDSLWAMYNHIAYALQKSHPRKWMDQQTSIHWFLCDFFDLTDKIDPPGIISPPVAEEEATVEQVLAEGNAEEEGSVENPDAEVEAAEALDQPALVEAASETMELNDPEPAVEVTGHPVAPAEEATASTMLEEWMLNECKQMGVSIDKKNKFIFFMENQEIPDDLFNATVELGWTIQPALPFPVEE
jgi:hypothetical protein